MSDADESTAIAEADELESLKEEARQDLLMYITACDPHYLVSRFHVLLAHKLQQVVEGKIKRLIVTVPPRVGKTRQVCIEMPSFALGKYPDKEIVVAGYSQDLPNDSSYKCRLRMREELYQELFPTRLAPGREKIQEWGVVGGGRYQAVGVGGGLTGRGADILVLDDLVKDFSEAISQTVLDGIWNWIWSVGRTRLSPNGAIILIMTRWAVDDPVGRMLDPKRLAALEAQGIDLKNETWDVINLPALADGKPDLLGRKEGESIFPEKWNEQYYKEIKATSLSYIWSSLYEGNPVPPGGKYIPVQMIKVVDKAPEGLRWHRAWDLAGTAKKKDDETAGVAGSMGPDGTFYIRDMMHKRWLWPEARGIIAQVATVERIPVGIEAVGGFKTAYQNLMEVMPPTCLCMEYNVDKDKLTRALPWIALIPKGKFAMVAGPWNMEFLVQAERFSGQPTDDDDMVDAVSGAFAMASGMLMPPTPVTIYDRLHRAQTMRRNRSLDG